MRESIRHTLYTVVFACVGVALAVPAAAQRPPHHAGHGAAAHDAHTKSSAATTRAVLTAPVATVTVDTTITIQTVGSNLEFSPAEIAVKTGQRLRIRYVNEGTFPHNIVVVKTEADIDPLGLAAFEAGDSGYIPKTKTDRMVAHSKLAAPGETVEFELVVPEPGQYPFVCLYPGHYNMMVGTLRSLP